MLTVVYITAQEGKDHVYTCLCLQNYCEETWYIYFMKEVNKTDMGTNTISV